MKYLELRVDDKLIKNQSKIEEILLSHKLFWLIDSEFEDASLEIKKNTIIWHSGTYYSGTWHYGIFKNGCFYGIWENGIFEDGTFKGTWKSGIRLKNN